MTNRQNFAAATLALIASVAAGAGANAQTPAPAAASKPWFGLATPKQTIDVVSPTIPVAAGNFGGIPPYVPQTGPLKGEAIFKNVETIVGFSLAEKAAGEPLWGRISGFPGLMNTVEWTHQKMLGFGLKSEIQRFPLPAPQWAPKTWQVTVVGDEAFGPGSRDIVLQSAYPQPSAPSISGEITAPLVVLGTGTPGDLANVDLKGKIALVQVNPYPTIHFSNEVGAAQRALRAGAIAAINVVLSPGNAQYVDARIGCTTGPCFAVGWEDGRFLELAAGPAASKGGMKVKLKLQTEMRQGLTSANGVAILPGETDENIIINAHADGWFSGATDNGDGLAMMVALAEHYAKRGTKPRRTLVFVTSAGHHGPGNGPNDFVNKNAGLLAKNVLVLNLEHIAQFDMMNLVVPNDGGQGSRQVWTASTVETAKKPGVSNMSPFVVKALQRAANYGVVMNQVVSPAVPGDGGAFVRFGKPVVNLIASTVFYHSTADALNTISKNGLERAAGFFVEFIDTIDKASLADLDGPVKPTTAGGE